MRIKPGREVKVGEPMGTRADAEAGMIPGDRVVEVRRIEAGPFKGRYYEVLPGGGLGQRIRVSATVREKP